MPPSEIRKEARDILSGKWGKGVCILLAYLLFNWLFGLVSGLFSNVSFLAIILEIGILVISIPLSFGLLITFMKLKRNEETKSFGFIKDAIANFGKAWGIWFHTLLRLIIPVVCIILVALLMAVLTFSGSHSIIITILGVALYIASLIYVISRSLLYAVAYNVGYDHPELSSKECVLKSETMMTGNRGNYFLLSLSFIGWAILATLTLGIGYLWLLPYIQVSLVCFYDRIAKPEAKIIEEEVKIEE